MSESLNERERIWLEDFIAVHKAEIWKKAATNPFDPYPTPQCFGVAQHATLLAEGRLLYHEGTACYRDQPNSKPERHAWNTFNGERVDLSKNINLADGSEIPASDVYENYQSEQSYAVDEVRARMALRPGVLDFFVRPQYAFRLGQE
jgi:hypothetical protein